MLGQQSCRGACVCQSDFTQTSRIRLRLGKNSQNCCLSPESCLLHMIMERSCKEEIGWLNTDVVARKC